MCGDLEEEGGPSKLEEALYNRFLVHARALLAKQQRKDAAGADPMLAVLDKLFADALSRATRDAESAPDDARYELLSMLPVVFARLAGFMAGHCALQEDPLRKTIEALMMGYAEVETIEPDHGHDHDHDHEHGHHHHGHAHGHTH
jgi:hypothetical protein